MSAVSDIQGLSDLSQCAYALGMAFGRQAQEEADIERKVRFVELFDRCFHGFRVAVALKLRLARAPAAPLRERDVSDAEALADRPDPADRDRPERERLEYDRDRDREAASLPILLKTLNGVVAEAEALPGPQAAELPTLRELLAKMAARPAPAAAPPSPEPPPKAAAGRAGVALLARPPAPSARSRLLLGAAPGGLSDLAKIRRATGPP